MTKIQSILVFIAAAIMLATAVTLTNFAQAEVTVNVAPNSPDDNSGNKSHNATPLSTLSLEQQIKSQCAFNARWDEESCRVLVCDEGAPETCEYGFTSGRGCYMQSVGPKVSVTVGYICYRSGKFRHYCGSCPPGTSPSKPLD